MPHATRPRSHSSSASAAQTMARGFDEIFECGTVDTSGRTSERRSLFVAAPGGVPRLDRGYAARVAVRGLRPSALDRWLDVSRMPRKKDLLQLLGMHSSTLSRMPEDRPLQPEVTERLLRQSDLFVRAAEVFGEDGPAWMMKPHPVLQGSSPAEYAASEYGGDKVRAILNAIEHGGVV